MGMETSKHRIWNSSNICVGRLSKLRLDVDLTRHLYFGRRSSWRAAADCKSVPYRWVGSNPTLPTIGLSALSIVMSSSKNETLRVLSSLPKGVKMNTIRCEYRRGSFHSQNPRRVKRESCSYGWRLLVVFELNKSTPSGDCGETIYPDPCWYVSDI